MLSEAKNDPTTNWPGLTVRDREPTSSTMPTYSWPIGDGPSTASIAAVGPQIGAADAGRGQPDDRIGRLQDRRLGPVLDADVARGST